MLAAYAATLRSHLGAQLRLCATLSQHPLPVLLECLDVWHAACTASISQFTSIEHQQLLPCAFPVPGCHIRVAEASSHECLHACAKGSNQRSQATRHCHFHKPLPPLHSIWVWETLSCVLQPSPSHSAAAWLAAPYLACMPGLAEMLSCPLAIGMQRHTCLST